MTVDVRGKVFKVGQQVARADKMYSKDGLFVKICEVTRIEGEKVYLDYSHIPLKFPDRVAIVE